MTNLTKKGKKYAWTEECASAFEKLKNKLFTAPILKTPSETEGIVTFNDASERGLEYILMEHRYVIAYVSKQLRLREKNYPIHVLELAAIIFALKICRHYLLRDQVLIYTDHKSQIHLHSEGIEYETEMMTRVDSGL